MKTLILITVCLLLGCEKRAVDPEIQEVKEWLLAEENQTEIADALAICLDDLTPELSGILREHPKSLDHLISVESWTIKRITLEVKPTPGSWFALFAEGWLFVVIYDEGAGKSFFNGFPITKSEFENLGNPVSFEEVLDLNGSWIAKERAKEGRLREALESHKRSNSV